MIQRINAIHTLIVIVVAVKFAHGCECSFQTLCSEVNGASKIFVGNVVSVAEDQKDSKNLKDQIVVFEVVESLKGDAKSFERIRIFHDACVTRSVSKGSKLIVFANSQNIVGHCNRTTNVDEARLNLAELRRMIDPSQYFLRGRLFGLDPNEASSSKVVIRSSKGDESILRLENSEFTFSVPQPDRYKVRIFIPFDVRFESVPFATGESISTTHSAKGSFTEYYVDFSKLSCDERAFHVERSMTRASVLSGTPR